MQVMRHRSRTMEFTARLFETSFRNDIRPEGRPHHPGCQAVLQRRATDCIRRNPVSWPPPVAYLHRRVAVVSSSPLPCWKKRGAQVSYRNGPLRARNNNHTPFIGFRGAPLGEAPWYHRYRMAGTRCLHGTYTTRQRIKRMCVPCFTVQVRSRWFAGHPGWADAAGGRMRLNASMLYARAIPGSPSRNEGCGGK